MERDIVKRIEDLMDLFDEDEITTADQTQRPEDPYRDFNERNPLAGGGMLVQPGFGGIRQGYSGEYGPNIRASDLSNSFEVTIERGKKVFNKSFNFKKYGGEEKALKAAKEYRDEKRKLSDTRGNKKGGFGAGAPGGIKEQTGGKAKIEKILNKFIKEGKTSFSNADIRAKIKVKDFYKTDENFRKAVDTIKKKPEYENLTFIKKPRVENPDEAAKVTREKRESGLKDTDPTKAKGTKKFNYHHIRQIAGGVPLTTDDVMIINQRINSSLGTKYDKPLNAISAAIQKNNKLALEAMNAKEETLALEYMKRSDELNARAEKIVNSAIDKLPKKYKGYVGFNKFTLPRDEYGFPISNEPLFVKKVGGMPVSKDAIDLTDLNLKQEAKFRKIVKAQAEKGQIGKIKNINNLLSELAAKIDPDGCGRKTGATGGRIGLQFGSTPCALKAKNYLNQVVKKGVQNEPPARVGLIKKIISGTGNFIKQGLSPKEFFKLENLVGKSALYATAIVDSGLLLDDVLRKKEPINVATAENFLFGNLLNLDADAENAKNIINDPNLSPAAKTYAQGIIDQDNFRKLSQTYATNLVKNPLFIPSGAKAKADTALANLKNKILNTPETGRMDYESLLADKQDAFTAKEKPFDAPDKPGLPSFTSGQLEKRNVPGEFVIDPSFPLPLQKETLVPSYVSPSYSPERPEYEKDEFLNQYLKSIGEEPLRPGEGTLFRMNTPQLGLFGTQERFARGGLSGGDTSGPPPERGPNPQGLPSLLKRVRNI